MDRRQLTARTATLKPDAHPRRARRFLQAAFATVLFLSVAGAAAAQDQLSEQPISGEKLITGLEQLAKAGNGEAYYHLGMIWNLGIDVPVDKAKALDAFRRSAELGDPLGAYRLGCYYDGDGEGLVSDDAALALKYKLIAAEAGYALAEQDVGLLYAGSGDYTLAREWIGKAAAQGWPEALRIYASIHNGAAGIARDRAVSAAYFHLYAATSEATDDHKTALIEFESSLSPDDKAREEKIIAAYQPKPTALTTRALSGQRAAQALLDGAK